MDWTTQVIAYCERTDLSFWAEPLNAVTNLAFLLAAGLMFWRGRGEGDAVFRWLVGLVAVVGLASGAWHTWAVAWAGAADSLSILAFILVYLYAANRHFWNMRRGFAVAGVVLFLPFAAAFTWAFNQLPFFAISAEYWPVALLIAGYGLALRKSTYATSRRLLAGATILAVSISLRSLDEALCAALPIGTHFLWHLLNAAMLAWMIETYRRHTKAAKAGMAKMDSSACQASRSA